MGLGVPGYKGDPKYPGTTVRHCAAFLLKAGVSPQDCIAVTCIPVTAVRGIPEGNPLLRADLLGQFSE
jgi:hypothetical protein